jgi:hypothetical protein
LDKAGEVSGSGVRVADLGVTRAMSSDWAVSVGEEVQPPKATTIIDITSILQVFIISLLS